MTISTITLVRLFFIGLFSASTTHALAQVERASGDAARGAKIFRRRCAGCHINKGIGGRGPNLTDIVGGVPSAPGFRYKSVIEIFSWSWSIERLDRYLRDPGSAVRGATMVSQVKN
jgi:cytochrome c